MGDGIAMVRVLQRVDGRSDDLEDQTGRRRIVRSFNVKACLGVIRLIGF